MSFPFTKSRGALIPTFTPLWNSATNYSAGNHVYMMGYFWEGNPYSLNMRYSYVSLQDNNQGHDPRMDYPTENTSYVPVWWKLEVSPKSQFEELSQACFERRRAINFGDFYFPTRGCNLYNELTTMQWWCENNFSQFIDHVNGPLRSDKLWFLFFDADNIQAWRQIAGLNVDGFRRSRDWDGIHEPIWLDEGIIQRGDIIGYWIIEDLQKALSSLRWTFKNAGNGVGNNIIATGIVLNDCSASKSEHDLELSSNPWSSEYSTKDYYKVYAFNYLQHLTGGDYLAHWEGERKRGKAKIYLPGEYLSSGDVYCMPEAAGGDFFDIDGLGFTDDGLNLWETFPEQTVPLLTSDRLVETNYIGNTRNNYFNSLGWTCPIPGVRNKSCSFHDSYWLIKWNFTNQNP